MERRRPTRSQRNVALATAVAALTTLSATAGAGLVNADPVEDDVAEWFDEVDPAMLVDTSEDCMAGATDTVFYRGDRIVLRPTTTMLDPDVKSAVNTALNGIHETPGATWATTVERIEFPVPLSGPVIKPLLSVTLKPHPDGEPHPIVELARALRREPGIPASPDYGMRASTPYSFFWPRGFPRPITDLTPPRTNVLKGGMPVGTGVTVGVFDVGLAPRAPGVLPNVSTLSSADNELIDTNGDGYADDPVDAHGLAIASVIGTLVPGALVEEGRVADRNGLGTDVSAARRMALTLRNLPPLQWPPLIVNSFGSHACDFNTDAPGLQLEPLGLTAVVEVADRFDPDLPDGLLIVASAGNEDTSRETYPAAFDSVLAVGALDTTVDSDGSPWTATTRTGPKAEFSNYGDWVDAWTSGVSLPMHHVTGVAFEKGLPTLWGEAEADGTSFATPVIASMIAEQMSITGLGAREAWDLIAAKGQAPLPECGSPPGTPGPDGVAVALVSWLPTVTAVTPASGRPVVC